MTLLTALIWKKVLRVLGVRPLSAAVSAVFVVQRAGGGGPYAVVTVPPTKLASEDVL